MAVGKGFLAQYSVFCVFGSVVGCVVVPLITQSIESVIFSAILISLTATHWSRRAVNNDTSSKLHNQPYLKDLSLRKAKEGSSNRKKSPKKAVNQGEVRTYDYRQRKEEKFKRIEEARKLEQRKQEEKRERKAKRKEDKLKQREEEKKILEEETRRRKIKEDKNEKTKFKKTHVPQKGWTIATNSRVSNTRKCNPVLVNDSVVTPLNIITAGDALYREKASVSPDSCESKAPSPPPSVWKVPEYVPPRWNPEKQNDHKISRPTTPFNQLYNPVMLTPSKLKNEFMNQHINKSSLKDSDPNLLIDTPVKFSGKMDNRDQAAASSPYSNISGLPSFFKSPTEGNGRDSPQKTYSLFGPEEPNRVLFQPIFQNNIHVS
ncbi:stress response protein NST1-like [Xenia sp. Carnegie-2017]|uniref:stress response protein NST1-like n=1 Tax=Xenia sp. Carnegie-2017 TaxID=2897299 RepID=UPI001F04F43F|nr:stress response protein NST1-like [Xenia sp. Carnegie-2017]